MTKSSLGRRKFGYFKSTLEPKTSFFNLFTIWLPIKPPAPHTSVVSFLPMPSLLSFASQAIFNFVSPLLGRYPSNNSGYSQRCGLSRMCSCSYLTQQTKISLESSILRQKIASPKNLEKRQSQKLLKLLRKCMESNPPGTPLSARTGFESRGHQCPIHFRWKPSLTGSH